MKDQDKTIEQLIDELVDLRKRCAEFNKTKAEYKKIKQSLEESNEKYKSIADLITDGIITFDLKGVVSSVNKAFFELTGFPRDKIVGRHFSKLPTLRVNDIPGYLKLFSSMIMGKIPEPSEFLWIHKDGTKRWGEGYFCFLRRGRKKVGIQAILKDITERKQAEEVLQEERNRAQKYLDIAGVMFVALNDKGEVILTNQKGSEILGYEQEEIIGENWFNSFLPVSIKDQVRTVFDRLMAGKIEPVEYYENPVLTKGGEERIIAWHNTLLKNDKGNIIGTLSSGGDITEHKRAEKEKEKLQAQLVQSEKMAGIGTLTSGIAHEFNNLLQIMSGHAEFAQRTKTPEDMEEALDIVGNTSNRASKIIKDLLTFSRRDPIERKLCDINKLTDFVVLLTEEQLKKHNIAVTRKYKKRPNVEVNEGEIQQVFLNMVTNARDAMLPKGGMLEIGIKKVKDNVEIRFTDTGTGIEKKNIGKVFEPFYTTKGAVGGDSRIQGLGLGLSVSYGIINRHDGTIEVESEVGKGTTFIIKLPLRKEETKKKRIEAEKKVRGQNPNL